MKMMKNRIYKNTSDGYLRFLAHLMVLAILAGTLISCGDDDEGSDVLPEDNEIESAALLMYRIVSPEDDAFFIGAFEEIPTEFDLTQYVEVGGEGSSVVALGDDAFVWDGGSTLTKWEIDRMDLSISQGGVLDLSGQGFSGEVGNPVSFSETEAYIFSYDIGRIVEFNPETMEIVETIDFTPLPIEGWTPFTSENALRIVINFVVADGVVLALLQQLDNVDFTSPGEALLFVFDPATNTISYERDNRVPLTNRVFLAHEDGFIYVPPYWAGNFPLFYGGQDPETFASGTTMLRLFPNGTWDPNFSIDFGEILGVDFIRSVPDIVGNEAIVAHWPVGTEPIPEAPFDIFQIPLTASIVNIETGDSRPFTVLDNLGFSSWNPIGFYQGNLYINGFPASDDDQNQLMRQDGIENYTTVLRSRGASEGFRYLAQLW